MFFIIKKSSKIIFIKHIGSDNRQRIKAFSVCPSLRSGKLTSGTDNPEFTLPFVRSGGQTGSLRQWVFSRECCGEEIGRISESNVKS
jgi:hypothetical protein